MHHPYSDLPATAFWKTGVCNESHYFIKGIYTKKFNIPSSSKIATAGSCFAQHIANGIRRNGFQLVDTEVAPKGLPPEKHAQYGYGMYSSRYGNIYTVKQLKQLSDEALGIYQPHDYVWNLDGRYYDAFRPSIQPQGFETPDEVVFQRHQHIERVRKMFNMLDVFIFTLGLTEMWMDKSTGTVYPTAPGVLAGSHDPDRYVLVNAGFNDIITDFNLFQQSLKRLRSGRPLKIILTVSPVPLTATASNDHVLVANSHSKSVLRAVAGHLYQKQDHIDYFPSFEIITNPRAHSTFFAENLRTIRAQAVDFVMNHFFAEHSIPSGRPASKKQSAHSLQTAAEHLQCEEAMLEAFRK